MFGFLGLPCDHGKKMRVEFALDYCDREIISWVATTKSIDAALVGDLMMQAMENRFGPNGKPPKPTNGSRTTAAATRQPSPGALPSTWGSS